MSFFDIDANCSWKCEHWERVLDYYDEYVSHDEVWEIARESKKLPVIGNIYQYLLLGRVLDHFLEETGKNEDDLDIFYWVNSIDTHLVINGFDICTVEDYWNCVQENLH